jgi:hypothetical protein
MTHMDFLNAYSLLVAVSTPVSVLTVMNVWLYMAGDRKSVV